MAEEIRFPRLGWSMEEGKFIRWLKKAGERVEAGQVLFEMEGEKALQEIEAVESGTLFIVDNAPGPEDTVNVGTLLGYLLAPGELPPTESTGVTSTEVVQDLQRALEPKAAHATEVRSQVAATPRARRLAKQNNIDWNAIPGTGKGGRVRESDIAQCLAANQSSTTKPPPSFDSKRFTPRRKVIADRLRKSFQSTIPVTLMTKADVSRLVGVRSAIKRANAVSVPAFTDLIAKVVASVLPKHPAMAVCWNSDQSDLLPIGQEIHIGIAVDTRDGLLVPVLRDVSNRTLDALVSESKALIDRAREGKLTQSDMSGGAITITNLGSYGIDAFTPIINLPEISILGIGAIRNELELKSEGGVFARPVMTLSLTFDHAAVDGAPAAAFLRDVVKGIESMN